MFATVEDELDPDEASRHSSVSGVADLARQAVVKSLMPIHLRPNPDSDWPYTLFNNLGNALYGSEVIVVRPTEDRAYLLD